MPCSPCCWVEDDQAVCAALTRLLTGLGLVVPAVGTAVGALREATGGQLDLIILDLGLPDLDDATTMRLIRGVSSVPVMVVNGVPGGGDRRAAARLRR